MAALLGQIVAAHIGRFGQPASMILVAAGLLLAITATVSMLLAWLRSGTASDERAPRRINLAGIACTLVAGIAGVVYAQRWMHPTENLMGGYDEAIYAITGANLAQTGHYRLNAALLPTLPDEVRPWVLTRTPRMAIRTEKPPPSYLNYHACLFIEDDSNGTLVSQFPIGFPAVLGSAHVMFGFDGQRLVNPTLLLITACLTGILMTSWMGRIPGTAAFLLWLWFPLQVWIGNSHYAEPLLQLLWLLALLGLAERTEHSAWSGALTGLALSASLAVKIDALPAVLIATLVTGIGTCRHERRFFWPFVLTLLLSVTLSGLALWRDNRAYTLDSVRSIAEGSRSPFLYGTAVLLGVGVILAGIRYHENLVRFFTSKPQALNWIAGIVIGSGFALAAYAYFARSHPVTPDTFYYWPYGREIRSYREDAFFRLGWYWQPLGLAVAVLGMGVMVRKTRNIWQCLAVGIGLLFLITFAYDVKNNPLQPYALRRFSPYALPLMLIGAAAVMQWLPQAWSRTRAWSTIAVTVGLLFGFWPINERLSGKTEYAGLIDEVRKLAEKIPHQSVVLVAGSDPLARLASCLEFVHGKPCLIVRPQMPSRARDVGNSLRQACELWQQQGRPVFVLSANSGETLKIPGVTATPTGQGMVKTSALVASEKILVTTPTPLEMPYCLNELRLTSSFAPPTAPYHSP